MDDNDLCIFTSCLENSSYELRKKKRYFNVLKRVIYKKEDLKYIEKVVKGCCDIIEANKRLSVLVGIFNLYYKYFSTFDYKVFGRYIEEELKGMSKKQTLKHGKDLYYKVFRSWVRGRDAESCAEKLGVDKMTLYWVLGRIRRHLRESQNKQLQVFGGMFSDLCRLNKILVPAREKK